MKRKVTKTVHYNKFESINYVENTKMYNMLCETDFCDKT
jgi:hypothetical protein